ncbi:MAG: hypothetical protein A3J74_02510 [Elusimicrobia bacterium RIFCSPHIGHO2_02_FULL_57_9]|nr:MAG: hypothetical protein A3J74_02510 [Elusimicrobia bacterium RIFCSPHIGHO2_02_FULL_57_9]
MNIWEGVYASFKEVPASGPGFNGERWTSASFSKLPQLETPSYNSSLLAVVAALAGNGSKPVKILDFGGGAGLTYAAMLRSMPKPPKLDCHIVENPGVCAQGEKAFSGDKRLRFHRELPKLKGADIIHAQSSLQYIQDWRGLLSKLTGYKAKYLILTDLPAGDFPTYASAQVYYESRIPHWFFNLNEVVELLRNRSYGLTLKTRFLGTYLGAYGGYPQENFPIENRIGKAYNLLFTRL